MATTFVRHRVQDYASWRAVYDQVADLQKQGGVTEQAVYRAQDDPNTVLVYHRFSSQDAAQQFFASAELRAAMERAGVDASSLRVEFYDEV